MAEDRWEAKGLRDLPEGDGEISGQDLKGTKHRRLGHCQAGEGAGHAPAVASGRGLCSRGMGPRDQHQPLDPKERVNLLRIALTFTVPSSPSCQR